MGKRIYKTNQIVKKWKTASYFIFSSLSFASSLSLTLSESLWLLIAIEKSNFVCLLRVKIYIRV